jgi:NAD(P)-dependent dehydrogenase (short-subunit alcohol dehydrogenase family)
MKKLLEGKVALVTGGGRGVGRGICLAMAEAGAKVVVNDLGATLEGQPDNEQPALEVVRAIQAMGGEAVADGGSVSEWKDAHQMVKTAVDHFGRIDIVVNNAGILRDVMFHRMSEAEFDAVVAVHLKGSFNVSRAAAPFFKEQGSGAYVHMTSTSGLIGNFGQANYISAKLGVMGLSKSIAIDMQKKNTLHEKKCMAAIFSSIGRLHSRFAAYFCPETWETGKNSRETCRNETLPVEFSKFRKMCSKP